MVIINKIVIRKQRNSKKTMFQIDKLFYNFNRYVDLQVYY